MYVRYLLDVLVADVAMLAAGRANLCRNIACCFRKAESRVCWGAWDESVRRWAVWMVVWDGARTGYRLEYSSRREHGEHGKTPPTQAITAAAASATGLAGLTHARPALGRVARWQQAEYARCASQAWGSHHPYQANHP